MSGSHRETACLEVPLVLQTNVDTPAVEAEPSPPLHLLLFCEATHLHLQRQDWKAESVFLQTKVTLSRLV